MAYVFLLVVFFHNSAWCLEEYGTPDQHSVYVVTYKEGTYSSPPKKISDRASSPDAIMLQQKVGAFEKGNILLYFTDFENWNGTPHTEYLSVASSSNGHDFSTRQKISIKPEDIGRQATDPSIIQLSDGKLRIYFMTPGRGPGQVQIRSAVSSDGVNFSLDDMNLTAKGNPEVFIFNQRCYMFLSRYENRSSDLAIAEDCLHWEMANNASIKAAGIGVLQPTSASSETGIKYFAEFQGLGQFSFDPMTNKGEENLSFKPMQSPNAIAADPSPIDLADGGLHIYFKFQKTH